MKTIKIFMLCIYADLLCLRVKYILNHLTSNNRYYLLRIKAFVDYYGAVLVEIKHLVED